MRLLLVAFLLAPALLDAQIPYLRYDACLVLENEQTKVVVCPEAGGRLLEYSWQGVNTLYLDPSEGDRSSKHSPSSAGRFDIGPEYIIPKHPELWRGKWSVVSTEARRAVIRSIEDAATGVQLTRTFELAADSSRLRCTQTMRNISERPNAYCYWSRTFVRGNGVCFVPLSPSSRFPKHYTMVEPGHRLVVRPEDPNIRRSGTDKTFLEVHPAPAQAKLGFDSAAGWLGYQLPEHDLLYVKRWKVDPDAVYNEFAGYTLSIWYPNERPMVELEPIGPRQHLNPNEEASFTETWWILENKRTQLDPDKIAAKVKKEAR